jgi:hypothetical protein
MLNGALDVGCHSYLQKLRKRISKGKRPFLPDEDGLYECGKCERRKPKKEMEDFDLCVACASDPY